MLVKEKILEFYKKQHESYPGSSYGRMKVALHLRRNGWIDNTDNFKVSEISEIIKSLSNEGYLECGKDSYYYKYIPQKKTIKLKFSNYENSNN